MNKLIKKFCARIFEYRGHWGSGPSKGRRDMVKSVFRVTHHDLQMALKVLKTPIAYSNRTVETAKNIVEAHDKGVTFSERQQTFVPLLRFKDPTLKQAVKATKARDRAGRQ